MPLQEYWVAGITVKRIADGRRLFEVFTRRDPKETWSDRFFTFNAWQASLCDRAWHQERSVLIASRETRYGLEIVEVA